MKFLVVGCGSIGKRHIRNLISLGQKDIIASDPDQKMLDQVKKDYKIKTCLEYEQYLEDCDVVIICSPTSLHAPQLIKALEHEKPVFVEKPVAHDKETRDSVFKTAKDHPVLTLVGCNMRFHQGIKKIKELLDKQVIGKIWFVQAQVGFYLPYCRPGRDYRKVYSASRAMGGGVVLDAIHEIDYLKSLFGEVSEVQAYINHISNLETDTEDYASLTLKFKQGVMGEVHMDNLQTEYTRGCRIVGEKGIIEWNYHKPEIRLFIDSQGWKTLILDKKYDVNQMYIEQFKHFLACLNEDIEPEQDIFEGIRALDVVLAAKESQTKKRRISL